MAVRQPRRQLTSAERVAASVVADRVARARAANPPRDPTGEHHEAMAELAERIGRDVVELLDVWDERAALREYEGEIVRAEAERLAVLDVIDLFDPQRRLA